MSEETPEQTLALLPHRLQSSAMMLEAIANALRKTITTILNLPVKNPPLTIRSAAPDAKKRQAGSGTSLALHATTLPQIAATAQFLDMIARQNQNQSRRILQDRKRRNEVDPTQKAKELRDLPPSAFHHA